MNRISQFRSLWTSSTYPSGDRLFRFFFVMRSMSAAVKYSSVCIISRALSYETCLPDMKQIVMNYVNYNSNKSKKFQTSKPRTNKDWATRKKIHCPKNMLFKKSTIFTQ